MAKHKKSEKKKSKKNKGKAKSGAKNKTSTVPLNSRRKNIRFRPDSNTLARIDVENIQAKSPFAPTHIAIVVEESFRGCGFVMPMTKDLQPGDILRIKVGEGPILVSEVRWRTELDSQVIRLGVMYVE